jgi:hypothetical protein
VRAVSPNPDIDQERRSQLRSPRRVGVDRQSRRSLVVGGALVIAILGGAGAVAWAGKPTDPPPAVSVDTNSTGRGETPGSPADDESLLTDGELPAEPVAGPAAAADPEGDPAADPAPDGAVESPELPNADPPAPTGPGPATVSPLGPGDAGFGWPSTAFGTLAAGAGR